MISNMNAKVRLVRCPRCRKVLPEPPEVLVYKCGGCLAVLQAKKRRTDTIDTSSCRLEEDSMGKQKIEQVSNEQEAGSSSSPSINESDRKCYQKDLLCSSTEGQDVAEKVKSDQEEYSPGKRKMEQVADDQEACSTLNQQSRVISVDEPDQNSDHHGPRSSTELSGHEDPESSPEATAHNRIDQEDDDHQDAATKKEDVTAEYSFGKQKIEQLSNNQEADCSMKQQSPVNSIDDADRNSDHNEPRCSSELSYHEDPASSPEAMVHHEQSMFMSNGVLENGEDEDEEWNRELFASPENRSFSKRSEIEEPLREATANTNIVRDSDGGSKASFKSFIAEKLLDTRQRKAVYLDEDDILSEDGSADLCHRRRFEHTSSVETLENARFGGINYYGYEGSVSSFDGDDHQVARKKHIGLKGNEHVDLGTGHHFKRHNEFHPSRGQWGKDEHRSKNVRSFFGNDSPSRLDLNEFHENLGRRPPVIPGNAKLERLELLKMVRELQDQLEITNVSKAAQPVPSYYEQMFQNHPGRYGQRMAFSGEAMAVNRRRDGSSCHHSCSQDRNFSAQLPRQHLCCNGSHYVPSTCCSSHCSGPSSPRHHSESEFFGPVHGKPEPDDYRHRNDVPKPHRSPKKRYVRPIAGGSPWITCYRCSELLQLPQSFLVFKKRYHSLQCGACMKVLNFTLSNGSHVHRYYPEEMIAAPPSSEVEDNAHLTLSQAGAVSCSDRSFQKSYSTETDRYALREFSGERRKATMSRDPSASTRPPSSRSSRQRKTTSEIEEIEPASNCSPLHRLMGYASPSKVIRG